MLERNQGTEKGEEYYGARAEAHLSHKKDRHSYWPACACIHPHKKVWEETHTLLLEVTYGEQH